jgi:adenosylmethionine-8-amino-7-oxononanoate aminotransferase
VICGFGRTGRWFGSQTYDIRPDIVTIAKGLSSGYQPIGGSVVTAHVAEVLNTAGEFYHGYTYSGHPVACAVALENLRILDEEGIVTRDRGRSGALSGRTLGDAGRPSAGRRGTVEGDAGGAGTDARQGRPRALRGRDRHGRADRSRTRPSPTGW